MFRLHFHMKEKKKKSLKKESNTPRTSPQKYPVDKLGKTNIFCWVTTTHKNNFNMRRWPGCLDMAEIHRGTTSEALWNCPGGTNSDLLPFGVLLLWRSVDALDIRVCV